MYCLICHKVRTDDVLVKGVGPGVGGVFVCMQVCVSVCICVYVYVFGVEALGGGDRGSTAQFDDHLLAVMESALVPQFFQCTSRIRQHAHSLAGG